MTREEALEILKQPDRIGVNIIKANDEEATRYNAESLEALDMAIKALELMKTGLLKDCESCREQQPYTKLAITLCTLEQLLLQDDACLVSVASVKEALNQQNKIIDEHYWKGFNNGIRTSEWRASKQQPMKDKTDDEIKKEREKIIKIAKETIATDDIEVIDSLFVCAPHDAKPLWFLGKAFELLSTADVAIFGKDWDNYRGCKMEQRACELYGIDYITIDSDHSVSYVYDD